MLSDRHGAYCGSEAGGGSCWGQGSNLASTGTDRLFEVPALAGIAIGRRLRLFGSDGCRAVYAGTTPVYVYDAGDAAAERVCIAMLSQGGVAFDVEIAAAFGVHRNTVRRLAKRLADGGMAAVVGTKPGPKGPSKDPGGVVWSATTTQTMTVRLTTAATAAG